MTDPKPGWLRREYERARKRLALVPKSARPTLIRPKTDKPYRGPL